MDRAEFERWAAETAERDRRAMAVDKVWWVFWWAMVALFVGVLLAVLTMAQAHAQDIPREAVKHRANLTRISHAEWGLDAPVAAFAAQIHQESGWQADAVSRVGAQGMAQFMPATATWWCERLGTARAACLPANPVWAMRAMVGYDRWLFERVRGPAEFDRLWAALRSYKGGLGHWQAESRAAGSVARAQVDAACGRAKRAALHCPENLGYPRRILLVLQPRYLGWGRGVAA